MKKLLVALASAHLISGCAVYMAATGEEEPDLGALKVGSARSEVELQLGAPVKSALMADGGRQDIYEYQIGNQPSTGRAIAHGTMDLLTLGLWEVVGTPIEGLSGDKHKLTVTYDSNDLVRDLRSMKRE